MIPAEIFLHSHLMQTRSDREQPAKGLIVKAALLMDGFYSVSVSSLHPKQ